MKIGEKINFLRKIKEISYDELAASADIPIGTLNKILSGVTENPRTNTVQKLADALGVSMQDLIESDIILDSDGYKIVYRNGYAPYGSPIDGELGRELMQLFGMLNDYGKTEAIIRIEEMTHIDRYTEEINYSIDKSED